ncbi:unnamed protein product [Fraxinus pennsylvanica]|uniref:Uncharacterized protein n=1 Tax=Fraxinus pennsylvanica TaxID=56036 RepID=A0AAD2DZ40_9LAMI|nr:unnamed protein product [Fraxinus pennsylvanica]
MARNVERESTEGSDKGPLLKANMSSFKLASIAIEKEVKPTKCMEWSLRGRRRKSKMTGRKVTSLVNKFNKKNTKTSCACQRTLCSTVAEYLYLAIVGNGKNVVSIQITSHSSDERNGSSLNHENDVMGEQYKRGAA